MPQHVELQQNLRGWMIFFIVMSVVVGAGIFNNSGSAMKIAGPGGALLAFAIMSAIAICVSECISELTQLFPIPNAIVEYVARLVDEDFGWAIGIAYWLTYSSIFAAQNMMAVQLSTYWSGPDPPLAYRTVIFYVVSPLVMLVINAFGVETFGWIETIGGALKIVLVVVTTFILWIMAGIEDHNELQDGFKHDPEFVTSNVSAVLYVIPIFAFGYVGIETIAITAFEAKPRSLSWPSKNITYIAATMYLLCMLSQCLNVDWENDHLPIVYGGIGHSDKRETKEPENPFSRTLAVIAIFDWGRKQLAGVLNGAIIFSVLSASNTTLYVASRTLYGMASRVKENSMHERIFRTFATVDRRTGVPLHALLLSWLMFIWVPFMSLKNDYRVQYVVEIIQTASSVSCLIVWIAICMAYLRFWWWQRKFDKNLENSESYGKYQRDTKQYKPHTWLIALQPLPAIVAIIGCFLTFAFCSATWWSTEASFGKVAIAYAAQFIVLAIFVVLKLIRLLKSRDGFRGLFRSRIDFADFMRKIDDILWHLRDRQAAQPAAINGVPPHSSDNQAALGHVAVSQA